MQAKRDAEVMAKTDAKVQAKRDAEVMAKTDAKMTAKTDTKRAIRARMKKERASLPMERRRAADKRILSSVTSHPLYGQAEEIYCYISFGEEVSTRELVEYSLKMGKKVAAPKILVDNFAPAGEAMPKDTPLSMEFYYISSLEELKEGYYGILEPPTGGDARSGQAQGRNVLVVMPGLAFDRQGGRIGYGMGFYDAYLMRRPSYRRMALAYDMQLLGHIPAETHDIRPEIIITEKEICIC